MHTLQEVLSLILAMWFPQCAVLETMKPPIRLITCSNAYGWKDGGQSTTRTLRIQSQLVVYNQRYMYVCAWKKNYGPQETTSFPLKEIIFSIYM